jgi:sugar phosphate isomerase/epimerase
LAVCSWSLRPADADDLVAKLHAAGLRQVQLALSAHRGDHGANDAMFDALQNAGIAVVSGMFGATGEDYSSLESIRKTGGFVPDATWEENWQRVQTAAAAAQAGGLTMVSTHAGFVPHDSSDPTHPKLVARLSQIADCFADHDLALLLETGQETAEDMANFVAAIGRPNVRVNFDPANMILYGMGDPIAALRTLMPIVGQVHIKDALPTDKPGTWGTETPVGQGAVDWPRFLEVLAEADYTGGLVIEREGGGDRVEDVKAAADHLRSLM